MAQSLETSTGTAWLRLSAVLSVILSIAGVVYAVKWGVAADGGRGGAIAVALSFLMLFLGRGTSEAALEAPLPPTGVPLADLDGEIARVRASVAAMLDWSRLEKVYLTISSVAGTLAWGFGDIVAKALGATP